MQRSWIAAITIIALAALLIPTTMNKPDPKRPEVNPEAASYVSDAMEQRQKFAALQNDMNGTARLMTAELRKDLVKLLRHSGHESRQTAVRQMMQDHPHIVYASWTSGGKTIRQGKVPSSKDGKAEAVASKAESAVAKGTEFESEPFDGADGSRYVAVGVPDESGGGGAVGFIKQDVLKQVERHQKQNLRIIPYPAEGKYRVESVKSNTLRDTTVRTGEDNGNVSHYYMKDAVVRFTKPMSERDIEKIKAEIDAESVQRIGDAYVFRSRSMETERLIGYFQQSWKTNFVEPHYLYMTNEAPGRTDGSQGADEARAAIVPNDILYSRYQWNLPSIETEKGWELSRGDEGVIIAVLDTGVQSNHPDLKGRLTEGANIVNNNAAPEDDVGHGTHVAGIIGATVNNGEGVAGVSWFNKIMPVKVLDASGAGSAYSVAQGIIWAVDHGAKVINMSLGNYAQAEFLHDAVKYAYERDVVLIAASGNDNAGRPGYPAAYPEVFAVAATNMNKDKAPFSNYGDYIDVAAPGDSIASTYPGGQYAALSGTSMASPHVAALAGLIRSVNPELTNDEVMELMRQSARDLGTEGKDMYFGYGEIDVDKALNAAANYGGALQTFPQQVKRRLSSLIK